VQQHTITKVGLVDAVITHGIVILHALDGREFDSAGREQCCHAHHHCIMIRQRTTWWKGMHSSSRTKQSNMAKQHESAKLLTRFGGKEGE